MNKIEIYTDGSALGNPGPGAFAAILVSGKHRKEICQGFQLTTNNRMELLAVIEALSQIKQENETVEVYSDSKYVIDAVKKGWVFNWEKKGFLKKKNPDLWKRFLKVYRKHKVEMIWVKGHAGHAMNERCDQLAVATAKGENLMKDQGYEDSQVEPGLFN